MTTAADAPRGLAGSAAVMFSGTLVSRLLGLVRNVVLVAAIGLTGAANSFSVANKLPTVVYMLVAGGVLNAILVPQIVRAMKSRDGGDEYVNRLLTMAGVALLALTTLLTAGAAVLVAIYAAELDPQWFTLAVTFAIWCIPQLFFYGMYTLLGQVLNARGVFGPYMWAPAVNNLVAIVGLVAYIVVFGGAATGAHEDPAAWTGLRIAVIAGTATVGVALQAIVLVVPLRRSGFHFRPRWGLRGSGLGRASRVATWAFASLAVAQLGFIAISNLAAAAASATATRGVSAVAELPGIAARTVTFVPGNAAWDNANFLYLLPQSLITVSLVTALFTRVSGYAASGDTAAVRTDLSLGLRTIGVFTVFAGGALAVVALPLVQAVLPTTTLAEAQGIARVVVALLAGIAALGAFTMVQRVYYAFEDTRSLFRLQIPLTAIVILGCLVSTLLPPHWWLVGAAVATTLSNVVGVLVAYLALRLKLPSLDGRRVLRTHLRLVMAATPAILVGWALLHLIGPAAMADGTVLRLLQSLARVVGIGTVMSVVYLLLLRGLRVDELDTMLRPIGSMVAGVGQRLPQPLARWSGTLARRMGAGDAVRTMSGHAATTGAGRHEGNETLDSHTAQNAPTLPPGTVLSGRYRLEHELDPMLPGTALWQGRDQILDRVVSALVLPGTTGPSLEALDAARRAALVDDPRLQRILDVGQHDDLGYIVTDVAGGPTLAQLAAAGTLPASQARAVIGEAASALETARRRGVHHLALTPAALHLTPDGQVKLAGTGIAAAYLGLDDGDPLAAARNDAVGLVRLMYVALTGRWPNGSAAADATRRPGMADAHLPNAPTDAGVTTAPRELRADVPADLDDLCRRTLRPGSDGPRTPSELIRELAPWRDINVEALASDDLALPSFTASPEPVAPPAGAQADADADADADQAPGDDAADDEPPVVTEPTDSDSDSVPPAVTAPGAAATAAAAAGASAATGVAGAAAAGTLATGGAADPAAVVPVARPRPTWPAISSGAGVRAQVGEPGSPDDAATAPPVDTEPPGPDTTGWRPRPLTGTPAPTDFAEVVDAGADMPAEAAAGSGRHHRGSAATAALGAVTAGAAAAVAEAARTSTSSVRSTIADWRQQREIKAEEADARQREEAVQAALSAQQQEAAAADAPAPTIPAPVTRGGTSTPAAVADAPARPATDPSWPAQPNAPAAEARPDGAPVPFRERRLDPTPIVLAIAFVAVILAAVLAFRTLFADSEPVVIPTPTVTQEAEPEATDDTSAAPEATTEPEPTTEAAEPPVIASLAPLDPEGDGAENPELTDRALDDDPSSYWRSRSYVDPSYGMKSGIGLAVELEEETVVSAVTLDLMGQGGNVEIRATDPSTPTEGDLLASGEMGPDTTFTFDEPVTTDQLVLWFTELPAAASDGRNRVELAGLTVE